MLWLADCGCEVMLKAINKRIKSGSIVVLSIFQKVALYKLSINYLPSTQDLPIQQTVTLQPNICVRYKVNFVKPPGDDLFTKI
jgi:hypothetical protein